MRFEDVEASLEDLSALDGGSSFLHFRSSSVRFVWTNVPDFRVWVLNAFSPRDYVFWSVGTYGAFRAAHRRLQRERREQRDALGRLQRLIRRVDAEERSVFSFVLLSGLTAQYGDRFMPTDLGSDYFRLAQRHFSIAVPTACRESVSLHYREQLEVFGPEALRSCDERTQLVSDASFNRDEKYQLLGMPLGAIREGGPLADESRRLWSSAAAWTAGVDVNILYGYPGEISLALLDPVDSEAVKDLSDVARFRAHVANRICPLSVIERLHGELDTPGWSGLPELKNELAATFHARLSRYPVIRVNPLPQPGCSDLGAIA